MLYLVLLECSFHFFFFVHVCLLSMPVSHTQHQRCFVLLSSAGRGGRASFSWLLDENLCGSCRLTSLCYLLCCEPVNSFYHWTTHTVR
uniref:Putative secreted protein n=1 Tax=Amblyomma cajennense TaxID=34607 RepID=A0A023FBD3_AMBCJ